MKKFYVYGGQIHEYPANAEPLIIKGKEYTNGGFVTPLLSLEHARNVVRQDLLEQRKTIQKEIDKIDKQIGISNQTEEGEN